MSSGTNTFTPTGSVTTARAEHTATLLPNGKVLIAGGDGVGFQPIASAELYDSATGMFTPTGSMTTPRTWGHTATLLSNGKVLIAGGSDRRDRFQPIASAELYDSATGTFTPTGSMASVQRAGPATLLQDGRVLITAYDNAEIYDPASGTFALTGPYVAPSPVFVDTATLLPDGRVLVTGCAAQCSVGASELFDPQTGSFSLTGQRPAWATVSTATLLIDGKVLFVQGYDSESQYDADVYDPATGTFTQTAGNIGAWTAFSAAARLADGTVLITGGQLPGGNGNPATELYLPATGAFAFAGNMTTGRHQHTATLLPDGSVLIAGGVTIWGAPPQVTASAEIYKPAGSGP